MVDNRDEKRISLRVSPELHEQITKAAHNKNLSVNGFIIQALEDVVGPNNQALRLAVLEDVVQELQRIVLSRKAVPNS